MVFGCQPLQVSHRYILRGGTGEAGGLPTGCAASFSALDEESQVELEL
jgi:hypothetical protein